MAVAALSTSSLSPPPKPPHLNLSSSPPSPRCHCAPLPHNDLPPTPGLPRFPHMFYALVLFNVLGFKSDASLYFVVIPGAINVVSTIIAAHTVDQLGRRIFLLQTGVQMFVSHVAIAVILGLRFTDDSNNLGKGYALVVMVMVMVCMFVLAFAWSWGPLGWLIPSETFPLETRSAGQSVAVCTNLLFTFIIAQTFLSLLCPLEFAIFTFFAAWVIVMSVFVLFFLPETKNIPIEEMIDRVWRCHWFWKRFLQVDGSEQHRVVAVQMS